MKRKFIRKNKDDEFTNKRKSNKVHDVIGYDKPLCGFDDISSGVVKLNGANEKSNFKIN